MIEREKRIGGGGGAWVRLVRKIDICGRPTVGQMHGSHNFCLNLFLTAQVHYNYSFYYIIVKLMDIISKLI